MKSSYSSVLAIVLLVGCSDDAPDDPNVPVDAGDGVDASSSRAEEDAGTTLDAALDASIDAAQTEGGDADVMAPDSGETVPHVDAATDAAASSDAAVDSGLRDAAALPYARGVDSFTPGANAGFGSSRYPAVVLGPPQGKGTQGGSLDVLSLGVGGEIVLDFGTRSIVDGEGADFIVFENAFYPGGDPRAVFAELGEVSVSDDKTSWATFPCSTTPAEPGKWPGCAGWTPTLMYDPFVVVPLDPGKTGGDAFDLATVNVASARYVRIRDLSTMGAGDTAGFDLDAIGIIHAGD